MFRRILKYGLILIAVLAVLILAGGVYARSQLRASLPQVDGAAAIAGLTANVRVDRDALGVPTITGATCSRPSPAASTRAGCCRCR